MCLLYIDAASASWSYSLVACPEKPDRCPVAACLDAVPCVPHAYLIAYPYDMGALKLAPSQCPFEHNKNNYDSTGNNNDNDNNNNNNHDNNTSLPPSGGGVSAPRR